MISQQSPNPTCVPPETLHDWGVSPWKLGNSNFFLKVKNPFLYRFSKAGNKYKVNEISVWLRQSRVYHRPIWGPLYWISKVVPDLGNKRKKPPKQNLKHMIRNAWKISLTHAATILLINISWFVAICNLAVLDISKSKLMNKSGNERIS